MASFSTTALPPGSPLFRGRQAELERLRQLCLGDVTSYIALYGGRQNGKTSLLFQLEAALRSAAHVCRVEFQLIKGATPREAFAYLAEQITFSLPAGGSPIQVGDGPALQRLLAERLAKSDVGRFVLLLDEWGALPAATREALANTLRAIFHTRLVQPALAKLQVLFSGGVELYDLVITEASSLHNICEEVYLADLPNPDAVALVADRLRELGVEPGAAGDIGAAVFARVGGHPYLTQRIGRELEHSQQTGAQLDQSTITATIAQIERGDPLLRRIRDDLREYQLEEAARRLLTAPPPFSRLDDAMARLELVGLARPAGARWAPRNPLLAEVFRGLLGLAAAPATPPQGNNDPAALRRLLVAHFNDGELRDLCFDLGIDYESLPGQGKADKARELVAHAGRHGRTRELVARCRELRPQADWAATKGADSPAQVLRHGSAQRAPESLAGPIQPPPSPPPTEADIPLSSPALPTVNLPQPADRQLRQTTSPLSEPTPDTSTKIAAPLSPMPPEATLRPNSMRRYPPGPPDSEEDQSNRSQRTTIPFQRLPWWSIGGVLLALLVLGGGAVGLNLWGRRGPTTATSVASEPTSTMTPPRVAPTATPPRVAPTATPPRVAPTATLAAASPGPAGTAESTGDAAAGAALFAAMPSGVIPCIVCHNIAPGSGTLIGPSLSGLKDRAGSTVAGETAVQYVRTSIVDPNNHVVDGFQASLMPLTYDEQLTEEQIEDLVAYLLTLP